MEFHNFEVRIGCLAEAKNMHELEAIKRLEKEIQETIKRSYAASKQAVYQHANGRRLFLNEAMEEGLEDTSALIGALVVVVAAGHFVSVDRVIRSNQKYKKQRRIIFYLDSKAGQVGSTLLLELLKLRDGDEFSKPKFVQQIDEMYFQSQKINISSGEINEALSRIFRKTMGPFFGVKGKHLIRNPFYLHLKELKVSSPHSKIDYESFKHEIDSHSYDILKRLNASPMI